MPARPTILIVDDDALVRKLLSLLLRSKEYLLLVAQDGKAALDLVQNHTGPLDLLIVDLSLPDLCGVTLSETISDSHHETKVLYISGYDEEEATRLFKPEGFEGRFLAKPFLISDIAKQVEAILSGEVQRVRLPLHASPNR